MYLEKLFKRVAAGGAGWTADVLPGDGSGNAVPPGTQGGGAVGSTDNYIDVRGFDPNGFQPLRLVVGFTTNAGTPPTLTANVYVWDKHSKAYLLTPDSPVTLTAGKLAYCSLPVLAPPAQNQGNQQGNLTSDGVDAVLIVTPPSGAPANGNYTFVFGPGYGRATP